MTCAIFTVFPSNTYAVLDLNGTNVGKQCLRTLYLLNNSLQISGDEDLIKNITFLWSFIWSQVKQICRSDISINQSINSDVKMKLFGFMIQLQTQ